MIGVLNKEIIEKFKEFQKITEKYKDLNIENVEFEIKRIHSDKKDDPDVICKKRMGFTPKTTLEGDINWFSVKDLNSIGGLVIEYPNTAKKTTMNLIKESVDKQNTGKSEKLLPIKKGDILVSFKLSVGIVKIYNSNLPAYCNEAIDILTPNENIYNKYLAYNCLIEYPKYGVKTNNGFTLNDEKKKEIKIYIPKDLNKKYTSYKIQEVIVEFLEDTFNKIDNIKNNINKRYSIYKRLQKALIPSTFNKKHAKITFEKYAKEHNIDFDITDIEFDIKKIISDKKDDPDVICKKRMGFTPKTAPDGDINWFRVEDLNEIKGVYINNPNTIKKTTMDLIRKKVDPKGTGKSEKLLPIKKGDILVSFLATPGVAKIYNSEIKAYCNQAIDILSVNPEIAYNKYIAYNCSYEYPKYAQEQMMGFNLNDDDKKKIKIYIPKPLKSYSSLDIQKIIADFIEFHENRFQKEFENMDRAHELCEKLRKLYLSKTFSLLRWEGK